MGQLQSRWQRPGLETSVGDLLRRVGILERKPSGTATINGHVIEDEGSPLSQRPDLNFVGAGVTVTDSGGKTVVTIPDSSLARATPRFMYASRSDSVGPSAAWAPTGAWAITTNDDSYPSVTNPVGNWRGSTFNVNGNTLGFNLDAPRGSLTAQAVGTITAWSGATPATVAFGVGPKPGVGLGSFTFSGVYPYIDDGGGTLHATGPQRPVITVTLLGFGPVVYTESRWQALKYSTLGADADITPTALQDSIRTTTMTIQVLFVHLADWELS